MVTHDPRAAARAERVLHLDKGRLVDDVRAAGGDAIRTAVAAAGSVETGVQKAAE